MTTTTSQSKDTAIVAYSALEAQDHFINYVKMMADYWTETVHYAYPSWVSKISGFMHSFHVASTGSAGGLDAGFDILVTPNKDKFKGYNGVIDINDGSLQYVSLDDEDSDILEESVELWAELEVIGQGKGDPELTLEEVTADQLRLLWHLKLAEIAQKWEEADLINEQERTYGFIDDLLGFIDKGDENFDKIALVMAPHPEDKEYDIENGNSYYEPHTVINGSIGRLSEAWAVLAP